MKREVLSLQTNSWDKAWQFLNIQVILPADAQTRRQADSVPRSCEYSGGIRITHRPEDPQFGGSSCFSKVSPRKCRALAKIRPRPLPSTPFPIHYSLIIKTQSKTTKRLSRDCWIFSRYFKPPKEYSGATVTNRIVNRSINRRHHYRITADKIGL